MIDKIKELREQVEAFEADNLEAVEAFRVKMLSKKGLIPALFQDFKDVDPSARKQVGMELNTLKNAALQKVNELKEQLETTARQQQGSEVHDDLTKPADFAPIGSRHPLAITRNRINS
ncbi:MAG: phenylalanine--tRNA ligase subunit alpha, partial [Bacteroidales bacterium]